MGRFKPKRWSVVWRSCGVAVALLAVTAAGGQAPVVEDAAPAEATTPLERVPPLPPVDPPVVEVDPAEEATAPIEPEPPASIPPLPPPEAPDQALPPSALQDVIDTIDSGEVPDVPADAEYLTPQETLRELELRKSIELSIDLDLIDINELRRVVEAQQSPEILRLSLRDCVAIALDNNQDILVTELEPLKAIADWRSARGDYDPVLAYNHQQIRARQSASAQEFVFGGITSVRSNRDTDDASLSGRLPTGTEYSIGWRLEEEASTFNAFVPEYSGGATFTLTQPLLQGFGPKVNLARIRIARNTAEQAQNQYELAVMDAIGAVVRAYWDLVGAIENVRVREESLANAERLLETNQRRLDIGTAATIDVLQTKAEVANRQGDLVSARSQHGDAEDNLKRLMSMIDDERLANIRIVPVDRPLLEGLDLQAVENFDLRVERSIENAVTYRPEVRNAELDIKNAAIEAARAKNLMLPQVDLTGTLSLGGRGKTAGDPFRGFSAEEDKLYSWGVQFSLPLGNRTARHSYTRAKLTKEQNEQRLKQVLETLAYNARVAARQVMTSRILVATNEQTRILQEANVAAEEKKLELGVTTSYRVLDVQEDLTIAQVQEVQAMVSYQQALVELQLAEGLFLEDLGVQVEEPEYESAEPFVESILPFVE